jgi:hypothetical protein
MRVLSVVTVAWLLPLVNSAPTVAQVGPANNSGAVRAVSPDFGDVPLEQLLARPEVRTHLRLTLRQQQQLDQPERAGTSDPPADGERRIREVLSPEQFARLNQIALQQRGPLALADAKVADQINMDNTKRAAIRATAAEANVKTRQAISEAFRGVRGRGQGMRQMQQDLTNRSSPLRQTMDEIRTNAEIKILALLSDEEKARWQKAQGEPFTPRADRAPMGTGR